MKKLATALVSAAAIMTMSTTAFAAENPAEVFDRVMEKNNTIQSAEIQSGVHSVILAKDVIPDGQMKVDMAMHAEMDMQDTTDLKYLAQVASSILGQDSYSQVFYTDGYYYVDANGVKLKYPMPLEQIISSVQTGVNTSNMESSYMKGISLNEVNGKRVLAYEANPKKFSEAMSELDSKYVDEALNYKKNAKKPVWAKWGAIAACFVMVAVLGVGAFQSGLFGNKTDIATLDNGNEIIFVKSETAGSSIDIDGTITTRQLTETEAASLFPNLTVTAHAVFRVDDTVSDSNKELIGFEGKIENAKVVISTTDIALLDTKIVGSEESSEVNGTSVTAGYFVTDRNSVGEQNVIYYATFKLGDSTVYVENAGAKTESESVKNDLATIIQELINNGALDLSSFNG